MPELTRLRPNGRMLGIGMALPGPFGVESMSFVGPTTMTGWKDVALRERLAEPTGLPAFLETDMAAAALGEQLYGLGARFSEYYYLYFGVGLGGAMVHEGTRAARRLGQCRRDRPHSGRPRWRAVSVRQSRLPRTLSVARGARPSQAAATPIGCARSRPIFRNAIATIENLFDPETVILGGLAPTPLLERLAGAAATLPNSISARRDRTAPRVMVARGGQQSVLRGAAALAVSGVLSPRFGQMFTAARDGAGDLLHGKGIAA